jgi:TATA-box binding protein (TBP) (component of TFIID and TFIIIB)
VIQEVIKQLKKINVNITAKPKITVQNIVASGEIKLKLNLTSSLSKWKTLNMNPNNFLD